MNFFLRICIAGVGAIGCTLAARLIASGQPVKLLARGDTLATLKRDGVHLTDLHGEHQVQVKTSDDPTTLSEQDLIFLCTKAPALAGLLPQIQPMMGPDTVVVPVVNGVPWRYFHGEGGRVTGQTAKAVAPYGVLRNALDLAHVVGCVMFIIAHSPRPGVAHSNTPHLIIFGEPDNMERLLQVIEAAGIEVRTTDRIRDQRWTKMIANLTSIPLSVVTGAPLEQLCGQPELRELVSNTLHEALLTAAAHGARVSIDPHTFLELGAGMGPVQASMPQDYKKGRPSELAAIGDAVLELAALMAVPMPVTRQIIDLARFRSEHTSPVRSLQ